VTQGMLFKVICEAVDQIPIKSRFIMKRPVISVRFDSKAWKAFDIMRQKGISGIAVVDEDGIIIHNTSTSDLKALITAQNLQDLSLDMTIEDFLVKLRSQGAGASTRVPVATCKKDDELRVVVQRLNRTGYHRVWVVNSKRKPSGLLSMADLFKTIIAASDRGPELLGPKLGRASSAGGGPSSCALQ